MPPQENEELKSMSLGDHLEELRARLILAILGLFVGMVICLIFGRPLLSVVTGPFDRELTKLRQTASQSNPGDPRYLQSN